LTAAISKRNKQINNNNPKNFKTMNKKNYLFIALAALAFTACSNDDEPGVNNGPVAAQVTAGIEGVQTRAAGTSWDKGDQIGITAESTKTNYTNVLYTTANGDGDFTSDSPIYFQTLEEVMFKAYYPYVADKETVEKTITANDQETIAQKKIDYMFATGAKASKTSPTVKFVNNIPSGDTDARFQHCMSMVTLTFQQGDDTDLKNMTDFTVKLTMTGTFNTTNGEAKATDEPVSELKITETQTESATYTKSLILFPQDVENGKFDLSLTLGGQTYKTTLTLPNSAKALASGMNYTFKIRVNKTEIDVEGATIAGWGNGGSGSGNATM
jgi:hypothetical protein